MLPSERDEQLVDLVLADRTTRSLADVVPMRASRRERQHALVDQAIVHHHLGARKELGSPQCEEAGVTRTGAHQVDRHGGVPPLGAAPRPDRSSKERPPASSRMRRASSAPTTSGRVPVARSRTSV